MEVQRRLKQSGLNLAGKASNKNNETKILPVKYINILLKKIKKSRVKLGTI